MLVELTTFTTMAVHHLLIGTSLLLVLSVLVKTFTLSAETKSWLWLSAFLIATIYPASLLIHKTSTDSTQTTAIKITEEINHKLPSQAEQVLKQAPSDDLNQVTPEWHLPSYFIFEMSSWLISLIIIWVLGSIWRSIQILKSHLSTRNILTLATPIAQDAELQDLTRTPILISDKTVSPLVTGIFQPAIVLPKNLYQCLSYKQLAPIVLHELAHIHRKDIGLGIIQEFIAILFWWSPIMRIFNRNIHINRELACDLRAASQLQNGKSYAQSLLDSAKLMLTQNQNILAMGLFTHKKDLNYRIEQVLRMNHRIKPKTFLIATLCFSMSAATIVTAQSFAPKINLAAIEKQSKFLTKMSRKQGELLLAAVNANEIEVVEALINKGLDINTPVVGDGTALIVAVRDKNAQMVKSLIDLGADVNQASLGDGNPLIAAAMVNSISMAEILVANGADVNASVMGDETPLINASRRGYLAMTIWLVEHGADVSLSVQTGISDGLERRSPLNMARNQSIRDYLLSQNAVE